MKDRAFPDHLPPPWALSRPKALWQSLYDLAGGALRMIILPDAVAERLHLTSLRAERFSVVFDELQGRVLDIGAGDNALVRLYRNRHPDDSAVAGSVGLDVCDWGGGGMLVEDTSRLPFGDESFDTVTFVACLNHIPERDNAVREAFRVLKPGGKVLATMIGRLTGGVGHALWWYSEDKYRDIGEGESMGMTHEEVWRLYQAAGFSACHRKSFLYGLNHVYIGVKET